MLVCDSKNATNNCQSTKIARSAVRFRLLVPRGTVELIEKEIPEELRHRTQDAIEIVHRVWRICAYRRSVREFCPLNFQSLCRTVRRTDCAKLLGFLKQIGLIESNGFYVKGVQSTGYRLGPVALEMLSRDQKPFVFWINDRRLHRAKLKKGDGRIVMKNGLDRKLYSFVRQVELDYSAAFDVASGLEKESAAVAYRLIEEISSGEFLFKHDFCDRVHTSVSTMHRQIRKLFKWNGDALCELDVSNSQILTLIYLIESLVDPKKLDEWVTVTQRLVNHLDMNFKVTKKKGSKPSNHSGGGTGGGEENGGGRAGREESLHRSYDSPQVLKRQRIAVKSVFEKARGIALQASGEVARLKQIAEDGRFYEYLGSPTDEDGRREFKRSVFKYVLYGNPMNESKITDVFRDNFPSIYEIIVLLKRPRYEALACLMQHIESRVVLDDAAAAFLKKKPEGPIFTIHDSFSVLPADQELATQCLKDAFKRVGLKASVSRK